MTSAFLYIFQTQHPDSVISYDCGGSNDGGGSSSVLPHRERTTSHEEKIPTYSQQSISPASAPHDQQQRPLSSVSSQAAAAAAAMEDGKTGTSNRHRQNSPAHNMPQIISNTRCPKQFPHFLQYSNEYLILQSIHLFFYTTFYTPC